MVPVELLIEAKGINNGEVDSSIGVEIQIKDAVLSLDLYGIADNF